MKEKFLPIGTVVLLKGGKKRAMITGFCSVAQENQDKIYDYSGCVYPEGYLSSNQVCLFDHDQIEKIYYLGFEDDEEIQFKDKLNTIVANLENQELKLEVLPKLMEFKDSIRMIGDYDGTSAKLYTEVLAGNVQGVLGFVNDEKSDLVPNTCLKCNTKLRSRPERIVLMLSKKFAETEYCNIEYIAEKNFDINELKNKGFSFKNIDKFER